MARRSQPLVTGEYYHVFNKSINKNSIFQTKRECFRALDTLNYYRLVFPKVRLSHFLAFGQEKQSELAHQASKHGELADIISFCLMPNHYHLLLKQNIDGGISKFISLFQNSYTRYRNTRNKQEGPLFKGPFKAILVEDDDQLLHLTRYIHLNPFSSHVVGSLVELENYSYSSLKQYLGKESNFDFSKPEIIISLAGSIKNYKEFVFNYANYQKRLNQIKHITFE